MHAAARTARDDGQSEFGCCPEHGGGFAGGSGRGDEAGLAATDGVEVASGGEVGARFREHGRDGFGGGGPRFPRSHQN